MEVEEVVNFVAGGQSNVRMFLSSKFIQLCFWTKMYIPPSAGLPVKSCTKGALLDCLGMGGVLRLFLKVAQLHQGPYLYL